MMRRAPPSLREDAGDFFGPTRRFFLVALVLCGAVLTFGSGSGPALAEGEPADVIADRELQAAATDWLSVARFEEVHSPADSDKVSTGAAPANAFYRHIQAGIRSNQERAPIYNRLTQGASRKLIRRFVLLQRLFLPLAWLIDQRAKRFQRKGIPIVAGDFVPVAGLPAPETPPRWRGRLEKAAAGRLEADLKGFRREFWAKAKNADFLGAASLAHEMLLQVEGVEVRGGCHLAMVKHFIESLGLSALHAIGYVRDSDGAVIPLVKAFLAAQLLPFGNALRMDLDAQALHVMGVGVVVNDIPHIPFASEWDAQKRDPYAR